VYQHDSFDSQQPQAARARQIPRHIGILMDGNGRWALRQGLPRTAGHRAATENIFPVLDACSAYGVEVVTLYVFSSENWKRPPDEVKGFVGLMAEVLDKYTDELQVRGMRFRRSGSLEGVALTLAEKFRRAEERTAANSGLIVNVAFNYGGRNEMVRAARRIVESRVAPQNLDETRFEDYLDTAGLPEMDLVIRTSGEQRLSNFCLWQSAHALFYATPVLWPDFGVKDLDKALCAYVLCQTQARSLG
jgi:undecaprenyl diphosphate synthase